MNQTWIGNRNQGIGGSEVSALFGCNPYITNVDLWKIKTNKIEPRTINKNLATYGHERELNIVNWFRNSHPDFITYYNKHNFIFNYYNKHYIIGTYDGIIKDKNKRYILEIKTYQLSKFRKKWGDTIPQNYYLQVLYYLLISGFEKAYLIVEYYFGNTILEPVEYVIERKEHLKELELIEKVVDKFWNYNVLQDIMPTLIINKNI